MYVPFEAGGRHSGRGLDNETVLGVYENRSAARNPNGIRSRKASTTYWGRCNTQVRYIDPDQTLSPGEFASRAATACLFETASRRPRSTFWFMGGSPGRIRARDRGRGGRALGGEPLHAFDVTCACAGLVEAIHVVAGYFALHPELKTALVCAGELWRDHVTYDLQSLETSPILPPA